MEPYIHNIQYYETDKMGIVHHSNYIRWMEEARLDFLRQIGISFAQMEKDGIASPVVSVSCNYRKPTTFGESVAITVALKEFRGVKLNVVYQMTDADGVTVCEAESAHCFLGPDGKLISLRQTHPDYYEKLAAAVGK